MSREQTALAAARRIGAAALVLAATFGAGRSTASAEVIERVVAVVNDDAILLSELRRRAAPFLAQAMAAPDEMQRMAAVEQLYRELLDRIVEEELFLQAAERMSVSVSRAEVDRAIGNVQRQSGLADAQFWEAVLGQGFSEEQYRSDVSRQLLRLKVLNNRARGRVNITEDQVRARFEMLVTRSRRQAQFTAAQLFFEVPEGASATDVREARRQADAARAALTDTDSFWEAGGMRLGTLSQGDLPEALEAELMGLDEGEVGQVVRGPSGFHVFLLMSRQQAAEALPNYDDVRMQIYQSMMEEAMTHQEEIFMGELRRQAVIDVRL